MNTSPNMTSYSLYSVLDLYQITDVFFYNILVPLKCTYDFMLPHYYFYEQFFTKHTCRVCDLNKPKVDVLSNLCFKYIKSRFFI